MPDQPRIRRPIIILSTPRSGSSLLYETLARSPDLWTVGGESHVIIEGIPRLHPRSRDWHSNRLQAADADPETARLIRSRFLDNVRNHSGNRPNPGSTIRLLEKTPRNALRVPFLARIFPHACFLYLYREPRETIASMLAGWRSGRYTTYRTLPGWTGLTWSYLLTPGWRHLIGKDLPEVVAGQWATATRILLDDLQRLPRERWHVTRYDDLVRRPSAEVHRLRTIGRFGWDCELGDRLPLSRSTLTPPRPNKWRANGAEVEAVLPLIDEQARRAQHVARAVVPRPS